MRLEVPRTRPLPNREGTLPTGEVERAQPRCLRFLRKGFASTGGSTLVWYVSKQRCCMNRNWRCSSVVRQHNEHSVGLGGSARGVWCTAVGGKPGWLSGIGSLARRGHGGCGEPLERVNRAPGDSEGDDRADDGEAPSSPTEMYFLPPSNACGCKACGRWVSALLNPMTVAREHHVA